MEEIQSWWEVPAVAHFCYAFRSAFNLFYIEIAELEAAILDVQDPEMCISLEQLIQRLLLGCFEGDSVTTENWEEKLHDLFDENFESDNNPFPEHLAFVQLTSREKVDVLFKLCEFRLDAQGTLETIKDIPPEDMQAKCVGRDSQKNVYWYFCDERLYKESPSPADDSGKTHAPVSKRSKGVKSSTMVKNGRKISARERKANSSLNINETWSIVCYNSKEWESFAKRLSKNKNSDEKELINEIRTKYLPLLERVVAEKDRFLRKRFLELAPKRTSSRISKVQAQKKIEEQKAAEAAENARIKLEHELAQKEAERKKEEIEGRRRRAEERHKAIEERTRRAQLRQESRFVESDEEIVPGNSKMKDNARKQQHPIKRTKSESSSEASSDISAAESDIDNDEEDSGSAQSDSNANGNSSDNSNSESECDSQSHNDVPCVNGRRSVVNSKVDLAQSSKQNTSQNSYNFYRLNSNTGTKGNNLHILNSSHNELSPRKRFRTDESKDFKNGALNDIKSTFYKEKPIFQPFSQRNFITYSRVAVTPSPSVIRLGFIKPASKDVSS